MDSSGSSSGLCPPDPKRPKITPPEVLQISYNNACTEHFSKIFLLVPRKMIVTNMIVQIVDCYNKQSEGGVWIEGGKGTGKSTCFFALQVKLDMVILLVGSTMEVDPDYLKYYCKEHCVDENCTLKDLIVSVTDKKILFVDLGRASKGSGEIVLRLLKFINYAMESGWFIVVSNSSGNLSCIDTTQSSGSEAVDLALVIRSRCRIVESRNFNKIEADAFCDQLSIATDVPDLVNCNPLYLCYFNNSKNNKGQRRSGVNAIARIRNKYKTDMAVELRKEDKAFEIGQSMHFLESALGDVEIECGFEDAYLQSFLHNEHLTYVDCSKEDGFYLKLYDPEKGFILLSLFQHFACNVVPTLSPSFLQIPAVRGLRFEEKVLQDLKKLCVSAKFSSDSEAESLSCVVVDNKHMTEPLRHIQPNVLYHLRSGHNSIDAILLGEKHLFFIQVSLSSYAKHKSKGRSMEGVVPKDEQAEQPTIKDYYLTLAGSSNPTPVYVFLSPEEVAIPGDQFIQDMRRVVTRQGNTTQESRQTYYGLVTPNTDTEVTMKAVLLLI